MLRLRGEPKAISDVRRDLQKTFADAVGWAQSKEPRSFDAFERRLWTVLLALGRALVRQFLAKQAAQPRAIHYEHDGRRYVRRGERTSQLGARFGKVSFSRPVGRRLGGGTCDLPLPQGRGARL